MMRDHFHEQASYPSLPVRFGVAVGFDADERGRIFAQAR
jgi:hypothetical protein